MSTEDNKAASRRFFEEVINQKQSSMRWQATITTATIFPSTPSWSGAHALCANPTPPLVPPRPPSLVGKAKAANSNLAGGGVPGSRSDGVCQVFCVNGKR